MKAFQVRFNAGFSSYNFSEVLLVKNETDLEQALSAKTQRAFELNSHDSQIISKEEVPLSKVKIGDLSITEFLLLRDM